MQERGQIYVITAPSGAGKTTIIRAVRESGIGIGYCVSHTTREPRHGEIQGKHYHFITRREFEDMVDAGQFVEWARVYGHLYGTSYSSMESELISGKDILLDLDIQGSESIKSRFPESLSIFILPPSIKALKERLMKRGANGKKDIDLRMKMAAEEVMRCAEFDFIVINDDLAQAIHEIEAIIISERARTKRRYPLIQNLYHL
jgi:guanylate kinase